MSKSAGVVLAVFAGLAWTSPSALAAASSSAVASTKARPSASPAASSVDSAASRSQLPDGQVLRAGGDYVVQSIDRLEDDSFAVVFKSVKASGRFDTLRLSSDHVHVAVKVGQQLRLSAEILSEEGPVAEAAQVVLFMPRVEGRVPVWLLSNKGLGRGLRATRYLEMHVPQNDFIIM